MKKEKEKKEENNAELINKIISLCKRRGFVFPGSEIYGGLANSFDYGPLGVELKNNIKNLWWKRFVHERENIVGIDAALIMNTKVWENSDHLKTFSDPLAECKICHHRFRADQMKDPKKCSDCGGKCSSPRQFNLMLKTFLGPVDPISQIRDLLIRVFFSGVDLKSSDPDICIKQKDFIKEFDEILLSNAVYFRPETAQAMFVDFKNVLETSRKKIPFGIAQIGKAFRNEITPGNFIFRTREFEQMEIEYFIKKEDWERTFEEWKKEMWFWMTDILGLDKKNIHELDVSDGERAHYSKKTIDFEYDFPFGRDELYGLAYRTDFDLKNHFKEPPYEDVETKEKFYPHIIEPTWGVDRSVLAVLCDAYTEEAERVVLKMPPKLAPYKVAVFPLLKNKPELVKKAKEVYDMLKKDFVAVFDDRGNIGKRYYSQDEIGTPFCVTIDFDSLKNNDITIRNRDTMKQERVKIEELVKILEEKLK